LFAKDSESKTLDLTEDYVGRKADPRLDLAGLPTRAEVKKAISQLKVGRAPGSNGLTPNLFKHGGDGLVDRLVQDFAFIWPETGEDKVLRHKRVCKAWKDASIWTIQADGV
jgi:hypothetical protein